MNVRLSRDRLGQRSFWGRLAAWNSSPDRFSNVFGSSFFLPLSPSECMEPYKKRVLGFKKGLDKQQDFGQKEKQGTPSKAIFWSRQTSVITKPTSHPERSCRRQKRTKTNAKT